MSTAQSPTPDGSGPSIERGPSGADEGDEQDLSRQDVVAEVRLSAQDLVPDRALESEAEDEFDRAVIAARIADLASTATPPLNIGLFGPWGSGKSSMAALIEEALKKKAAQDSPDAAPAEAAQESPDAAPAEAAQKSPDPEPAADQKSPEGDTESSAAQLKVKHITYDAWKYGGQSLRRNFISNAATQLGIEAADRDGHRFHRGLYESRRRVEVDAGRLRRSLTQLVPRFVMLYALFIILVSGGVAAVAFLLGRDVSDQVEKSVAPSVLAGGGVAAFVIAAIRASFEAGAVNIEQAQPSDDEEFSDAFRALISRAQRRLPTEGWRRHLVRYQRHRTHPDRNVGLWFARKWLGTSKEDQITRWENQFPGYDRLMFFIDELDRCDEKDVAETLVALRTFLDEGPCVFIVAADREVLERALKEEAEQATPVNEKVPYYATAGAFLDKIFQHQVALPPLRGRRLTAFARREVLKRRTGLWYELNKARQIEKVLPALIPSHVRSPRRVKVLLNNFATDARIAQSRNIDWPGRAAEIAKLTALRTEFPHFARALQEEARLTRFMLLDPEEVPESAQALVKAFRAETEVFLSGQRDEESKDGSDEKEGDATSDTKAAEAMTARHREDLFRYLRATSDVSGPRSDLAYLEAPGASFGLEDPDLGEQIERDAADIPDDVTAAIQTHGAVEQSQAVRLLADVLPHGVGRQQANVIKVLVQVGAELAHENELEAKAGSDASAAIRIFLGETEDPLDQELLVGALAIALSADDSVLTGSLFQDEPLLGEDGRLKEVAELYSELSSDHRDLVRARIAERLASDTSVLTSPMNGPERSAIEIYADPRVRTAVAEVIADTSDPDRPVRLADGLLEAAIREDATYPAQLGATLDHLSSIDSPVVYTSAHDHMEAVRRSISDRDLFNRFVLRLWRQAPESDWPGWAAHLDSPGCGFEGSTDLALGVLRHLFDGITSGATADEDFVELIELLVPLVEASPDAAMVDSLSAAITAAFASTNWWTDDDTRTSRQHLHAAVQVLGDRVSDLASTTQRLLSEDVLAGLQQAPAVNNQVLAGVRTMSQRLAPESLRTLAENLPVPGTRTAGGRAVTVATETVLRTRAVLALRSRELGDRDWDKDAFAIDLADVIAVAQLQTPVGHRAVAAWLRLGPPPGEVRQVLEAGGYDASEGVSPALTAWVQELNRKDRTRLISQLVDPRHDTRAVIRILASGEFNEKSVVEGLAQKMESADREGKMRLARQAAALRPTTAPGQRALADLIARLLNPDSYAVDILVALEIVQGLGDKHDRKRTLDPLLRAAAGRASRKLTPQEIEALRSARLEVPEDFVKKRERGLISRVLGRG